MLAAVALGLILAPQSADPYANETPAERDARMKWFREARFGMFIHWGVYSVPAGTYDGRRIGGIGEWIMQQGKIPIARYQAYAKEFNPVKYNAETWVKTAKEAGMKYMVITSKHHDGFAMFSSAASDWNIVKASPFGRDPLKELAAACKKYGMRLGFYYSQAQDWNNPGGAAAGGHWDKAQDGDMDQYIERVAAPQVREILSNYGKVSVLWWDTPYDMTKERAEKLLPLLKLQPGIIYNNRLGGGFKGDTETPEQFIPATGYPGRDWETCMTMNDTWGYKSYDQNWKSSKDLIRNLVDIASKGGNYLLNVGPTNLGEIPGPSVERLAAIGAWMKVNSKAIYATTASPFKRLEWGRCTKLQTRTGTTLFLHVFDWPTDGKLLVPGLRVQGASAFLLAGGRKLASQESAEGLVISVPQEAPDTVSTTIVLEIAGPWTVEAPVLAQSADGTLMLKPGDATLIGSEIQVEGQGDKENIGYWTNPNDRIEWTFKATVPGKFTLAAEVASPASPSIGIDFDRQYWFQTIPTTGSYTTYKDFEMGTVTISKPGQVKLMIHAVKKDWQPFNLRVLRMTPVRSH